RRISALRSQCYWLRAAPQSVRRCCDSRLLPRWQRDRGARTQGRFQGVVAEFFVLLDGEGTAPLTPNVNKQNLYSSLHYARSPARELYWGECARDREPAGCCSGRSRGNTECLRCSARSIAWSYFDADEVVCAFTFQLEGGFEGDTFRHGLPVQLFRQEVEMGLPARFTVGVQNQVEHFAGDTFDRSFTLEARYALANWNKLPLNPTISAEYRFAFS